MRLIGKISVLTALGLVVLFAAACVGLYMVYDREVAKNMELQKQLVELSKEQKQSAVMQSINAQMEEIALQERRISDEQREAAEQQTLVAQQMRHKAEEERQNALEAEQRALEASKVAKGQRIIAEHQRTEAEYAKRVADTLSYVTLSRQLANVAITQHQSGNYELADLLAYTSYIYAMRYQGGINSQAIYQALVLTSLSKHQWNWHRGTVTDIAFYNDAKCHFISCSSYGELKEHQEMKGQIKTVSLFNDNRYDFRDLFVNRQTGTIYAVSRTGHLVIRHDGKILVREVGGIGHLIGIAPIAGQITVFGENGMAQIGTDNFMVVRHKSLPYKVVTLCSNSSSTDIFDNKGGKHTIYSFDRIVDKRTSLQGQVTAYILSKQGSIMAYGMKDGSIYYTDARGKTQKLVGHRSQVSHLKIIGNQLYSSSYDGTLNLWMLDKAKIEPMPMLTTNSWIVCFTIDAKQYNIWCGDQKGTITEAFISVPQMVAKLKSKLKRNLTVDEWEYYVGSNVPYEKLIVKEGGR